MTAPDLSSDRSRAFGQNYAKSIPDRLGIWLSKRQLERWVQLADKDVADIGCGFDGGFAALVLDEVRSATLVDIGLRDDLKAHPKVRASIGFLPDALHSVGSESIDTVICNNVLEHLWEPEVTLKEMLRILRPGGTAFLNVPSWRGKVLLETLAFRLHRTPAEEIDDHKNYYDKKDLWRLCVASGFKPSDIVIGSHKLSLNTFAACKKR